VLSLRVQAIYGIRGKLLKHELVGAWVAHQADSQATPGGKKKIEILHTFCLSFQDSNITNIFVLLS
jgi:hypothetical protein